MMLVYGTVLHTCLCMNQTIFLPVSTVNAIFNDPVKSAEVASLVYVSDTQEGITRVKKGKQFIYMHKGRKVESEEDLQRIRKLVIPPAWKSVWICSRHNGHIQATGLDARNRKQYRYHADWNELRNQTKFQRLSVFGEKLPQLRARLQKDLAQKELCMQKVLALIVSLMERTYIRIGNSGYEKLYGSYGLTTLKDEHVKIESGNIRFSFKGKKGVKHQISLQNKKLAQIVKQCREIPGKELFQYYDEQNQAHTIHSEHVNSYIKEITGEAFTAKDFRTWAGSVHAIHSFMQLGIAETVTACKQNMIKTLEYVSAKLGNTRTVCKKYYVHPLIMDMYENKKLYRYLKQEQRSALKGWSPEELILLKILKKHA
jgi:DNA topoisomerase-1